MVLKEIKKLRDAHKTNIAWVFLFICLCYVLFNINCINNIYEEELLNRYYEEIEPSLINDYNNNFINNGMKVIENKNHEVTYRLIVMMLSLFIGGMVYAKNITRDKK